MQVFHIILGLLAASCLLCPGAAFSRTFADFQGDKVLVYNADDPARQLKRSHLKPFLQGTPAWTVVADIAALGRAENRDWQLSDAECLPPTYVRCLLFLAEDGRDGLALREYDTADRRLVIDGFTLPPGPTQAVWYDDNRILVAGNTGPGTLTETNVPRLVRLWSRGEPAYDATTILAAPLDIAAIRPLFSLSGGGLFHAAELTSGDGLRELYHFGWAQNFKRSALPGRALLLDFFQARAVALIGESWVYGGRRFTAGSLVAYPIAPLLGPASRTVPELAYLPPAGFGIVNAKAGRDTLFVHLRGASGDRLVALRKGAPDWPASDINVPGEGPLSLIAASTLADVALVERSGDTQRLYVAGRGRVRTIAP